MDASRPRHASAASVVARPWSSRGVSIPLLTAAALVAFAANSILCRAALHSGSIDAFSFSLLRVASGALVLVALLAIGRRRDGAAAATAPLRPDWRAGAMLAAYLVPFSWAYTRVGAGTGALVLFGAVQSALLIGGVIGGERPRPRQWMGLAIAFGGLVLLVAPGADAPSPAGDAAMAIAGIAWGLYTLRGRRAVDPLRATAAAFVAATPFVIVAAVAALGMTHVASTGALFAVASGGVTSALGYVAWYAALPVLGATRAAVLQVAVPILTEIAGTTLLGEAITARSVLAAAIVLAGSALVVIGPALRARSRTAPPAGSQTRVLARAQEPASTASRATCASQIARTRSNVSASPAVLSAR
jgi:drug/metabolite transporter (DMT)-like permease